MPPLPPSGPDFTLCDFFRTNPNIVVPIHFVLVGLSAVCFQKVYGGKKLKVEKSGDVFRNW